MAEFKNEQSDSFAKLSFFFFFVLSSFFDYPQHPSLILFIYALNSYQTNGSNSLLSAIGTPIISMNMHLKVVDSH